MTTETPSHMIVLQLTDELLTQLHPFMADLNISVTPHIAHNQLRLIMPSEVYAALVERVGGALDYDVRWRPNEYEPDGFVERVRPLELIGGSVGSAGCPQCGAQILATRAAVACACDQAVSLI